MMGEKVEVKRLPYRILRPGPAVLVTCCDARGRPNIITVGWVTAVSGRPPLVAISIGRTRYSHDLIGEQGEFVINVPGTDLLREVWYCGSRSGRRVDKFRGAGLTPVRARRVRPPVIKECIGHLECKVVGKVPTGDHTLFIGEVLSAYAESDLFKRGIWDIEKASVLIHVGSRLFTTAKERLLA
ncbi:TPA: flavin reductase family protein [Candidatus Bathyarchaeota archaeon]|nr:flavin reductase family protein [Candidatus Bathyarchaeota archaeon]